MTRTISLRLTAIFGLALLLPPAVMAQRMGFSRDEFVGRRAALMDEVKTGAILLFGDVAAPSGMRFRQDNDFFYFTGNEDLGAVLLMFAATKDAFLFLPEQTEAEIRFDGANLIKDPEAKAKTGLSGIFPASRLDEFLARSMARPGGALHLRLSPRDAMDEARYETTLMAARTARNHYNDQVSLDLYRIEKLRSRYPQAELKDITPAIDALRAIKTPEEIEILRRNGRLSAEGVRQAMLATKPGVFEYELEAAAVGVVLKGGARGASYASIVGSGPNTCTLHYDENTRRTAAGDLVLMDFGADLDHMTMDITRTWPASGKFTDEQKAVYRTVLEVQKACIEAYKPGATPQDVRDHVAAVLRAKGLDPRGLQGGFGHGVGLAVHDVNLGPVLKEGMVFAIEPGLYYPEKNIGIRIEDTVLITKDGCEVLTKDVPKEIEDIEKFLSGRK